MSSVTYQPTVVFLAVVIVLEAFALRLDKTAGQSLLRFPWTNLFEHRCESGIKRAYPIARRTPANCSPSPRRRRSGLTLERALHAASGVVQHPHSPRARLRHHRSEHVRRLVHALPRLRLRLPDAPRGQARAPLGRAQARAPTQAAAPAPAAPRPPTSCRPAPPSRPGGTTRRPPT